MLLLYQNFKDGYFETTTDRPAADLEEVGQLTDEDQMKILISLYLLECLERKRKSFDDGSRSLKTGKDEQKLLQSFLKMQVSVSDDILKSLAINRDLKEYQQIQMALIHLNRAQSLRCLLPKNQDEIAISDDDQNNILKSLLKSIDIGSSLNHEWTIHNAAVEIWNFYRSSIKTQLSLSIEWPSSLKRVYDILLPLPKLNPSLFVNVAASHSQFLIKEYRTLTDAKPKTKTVSKGNAPKDDPALLILQQSEEILKEATHRTPCSLESKLYLLGVWCQMICSKSDVILEPISDVDDITRLLSSLEIAELPSEKLVQLDLRDLLQSAAYDGKLLTTISPKMQIETLIRITQLSLTQELYDIAFGCLKTISELFDQCKDENLGKVYFMYHFTLKISCSAELLKAQLLSVLYTKGVFIHNWNEMLVEAFSSFGSSFQKCLDLPLFDAQLCEGNIKGLQFLLDQKISDLDPEFIVDTLHKHLTKLAWVLLKDSATIPLLSSDFFLTLHALFESIVDVSITHSWVDIGLAVCDLADKVLPREHCLDLKRYRLLSSVGKYSPLLKLTQAQMALVWLDAAKTAKTHRQKRDAFTICLKECKGSMVEMECIVNYLESNLQNQDMDQMVDMAKRLAILVNSKGEIMDKVSDKLLILRSSALLANTIEGVASKMGMIKKLKDLVISLLRETHRTSAAFTLPAQEETKDSKSAKNAKGKKDTKDLAFAKPSTPGAFPTETEWSSYSWPQAVKNCFLNCQQTDCFCLKTVDDRRAIIADLMLAINVAKTNGLVDDCFPLIKCLELLVSSESKEMLAMISLVEMDLHLQMGKSNEAKDRYKSFLKYRIRGTREFKSSLELYPTCLLIQGQILLKHGNLSEAKIALEESIDASELWKDDAQNAEAKVLLALTIALQGDYIGSQTIIGSMLPYSPSNKVFTDACMVLTFSGSLALGRIGLEIVHFLNSCTDRIKNLSCESMPTDTNQSLYILSWTQLRAIFAIPDLQLDEKYNLLNGTYKDCMEYCRKLKADHRELQQFYIKSIRTLLSGTKKNLERKIRNHCVKLINPIAEELSSLDEMQQSDYALLLELVFIELDYLITPKVTSDVRHIDEVLDDYLLNITDPILSISKQSCKLLEKIDYEKLPVELKGPFLILMGLYQGTLEEREKATGLKSTFFHSNFLKDPKTLFAIQFHISTNIKTISC